MKNGISLEEHVASFLPGKLSSRHNPHYLNWNHFKTFYFVAKAGSFTRAAEYLHTGQPSLSRIIRLLEGRLGAELFIRGHGILTLTRAGERVLEVVSHAFGQIEFVRNIIEEDKGKPQGEIRLRAGNGFITFYLRKYIAGFLEQYPDIRLLISSGKVPPEIDLLEADVVIRPPLSHRKDLVQIPLLINHVKLYASKPYLDKFGIPETPEDLDHHRLIAFGNPPGSNGFHGMNWHLTLGSKQGQERKAFIEVDLPEDRLALAASGLGIATVSAEHPNLEQYNLIEVLGHIKGPTVEHYYIYSAPLQEFKRVKLLGDYLVEAFTRDYGKPI